MSTQTSTMPKPLPNVNVPPPQPVAVPPTTNNTAPKATVPSAQPTSQPVAAQPPSGPAQAKKLPTASAPSGATIQVNENQAKEVQPVKNKKKKVMVKIHPLKFYIVVGLIIIFFVAVLTLSLVLPFRI